MPDISDFSDADLAAEMRRRAIEAKREQYAPLRDAYEPLRGFMDDEEPKTLSQLIALCAAPRPDADPDSAIEQNLAPLRRVLANTKTVWDNTVGLAFDIEPEALAETE